MSASWIVFFFFHGDSYELARFSTEAECDVMVARAYTENLDLRNDVYVYCDQTPVTP